MCLQSTTQRMASILKRAPTSGWVLKVKATGAGSAMPVVSIMTASYLSARADRDLKALTKSPRTVQHTQPLSMEMMSSLAVSLAFDEIRLESMSIAPNSFSMMAILLPWFSVKM